MMERSDKLLGSFSDNRRLALVLYDAVNCAGDVLVLMKNSDERSGMHFEYKHEIDSFIEVLKLLKDELPDGLDDDDL